MKAVIVAIAVVAVGMAHAQLANAQGVDSKKSDAESSEERKVEAHIDHLRDQLKITAAEEPQWNNVAKTMRENAQDIDRAIDKRENIVGTGTAVEDLNSYADVVQTHAAAVKRLADTFSTLYTEMSDSQKKTADEIFGHRHRAKNVAKN